MRVLTSLAAALAAWDARGGDWRAVGGVAAVYLAVRLGIAARARRRASARSWAHEPVMVRPFDWRRD